MGIEGPDKESFDEIDSKVFLFYYRGLLLLAFNIHGLLGLDMLLLLGLLFIAIFIWGDNDQTWKEISFLFFAYSIIFLTYTGLVCLTTDGYCRVFSLILVLEKP